VTETSLVSRPNVTAVHTGNTYLLLTYLLSAGLHEVCRESRQVNK
jgi:hypothetical protein